MTDTLFSLSNQDFDPQSGALGYRMPKSSEETPSSSHISRDYASAWLPRKTLLGALSILRRARLVTTTLTSLVAWMLGLNSWAGEVTGLRIEPSIVEVGQTAMFAVQGENDGICGIRLEYGTGDVDTSRMNAGKENFPRRFQYVYRAPGTYKVVAKGTREGSALGCPGLAEGTITVVSVRAAPTNAGVAPGAAQGSQAVHSASGKGGLPAYVTCVAAAYVELAERFPDPIESIARSRLLCSRSRDALENALRPTAGANTTRLMQAVDSQILRSVRSDTK